MAKSRKMEFKKQLFKYNVGCFVLSKGVFTVYMNWQNQVNLQAFFPSVFFALSTNPGLQRFC